MERYTTNTIYFIRSDETIIHLFDFFSNATIQKIALSKSPILWDYKGGIFVIPVFKIMNIADASRNCVLRNIDKISLSESIYLSAQIKNALIFPD